MNRLNNLFTNGDNDIDLLVNFLQTKRLPHGMNRSKYVTKYNGFILNEGKLMYQDKEVVRKADLTNVLDNLFETDSNVLAKGVTALYKYIASKFINITRREIEEYLKQKTQYQIGKKLIHKTKKPITATTTNKLWCVDLIDLSMYEGYNTFNKYIFVCIDAFSRKVWLEKMRNKTARTSARALDRIIERAGITPSVILSDNGGEFESEFNELCERYHIKHNHSPTYTPQANALVERVNKEIRKIIRSYMIKNNNLNWESHLKDVEDNKNNTYHSLIKATPNEIWAPNKTQIKLRPLSFNKRSTAKVNNLRHIKKQIEKFKDEDTFEVGDFVRVHMSALFSNIRRIIKEGNGKQIVVEYSPLLFRVAKVIIPRNNTLTRKRYELENADGRAITTATGGIKHFYSSDLLLVNDYDASDISMEDALKLNRVKPTKNDLVY